MAGGMFGLAGDDGMFGLSYLFQPAQLPANMYNSGIYGGQDNPLGPVAQTIGNVASGAQNGVADMPRMAISGATAPGDAWGGNIPPDQIQSRAGDLAGLLTLGAGAVPGEPNSLNMGIKAYHGSPHDFDQFSMDKIGTGEGAQAYGHGLYFAGNEGVAQSYRDALAGGNTKWLEGDRVLSGAEQNAATMLEQTNGDVAKAKTYLKYGPRQSRLADHAYLDETEAALDRLDPSKLRVVQDPGHMYEVDINADPNHMLDWDRPLSEQSEAVRLAAAKAMKMPLPKDGSAPTFEGGIDPSPTGEQFYEKLGDQMYSGKAAVSDRMKQAGFPGIKYLDAGSRTVLPDAALTEKAADLDRQIANAQKQMSALPDSMRGEYQSHIDGLTSERQAVQRKLEPTRNYVVFDDNLVNIVRKYGIAGAVSAGLLTAEQAAQMQQGQNQQNLGWISRGGT